MSTRAKPRLLSANAGKRAAELYYFFFFLASIPLQAFTMSSLSFSHANDTILVAQGIFLGVGAWGGATLLRAKEDRGKPFYQVYGFKLGCFLAVWAMVGGYLGTDPWYEVLHGHFAFNTEWNPNGVPFFMLPMTIAVFGFYTVILGTLFRLGWRWYEGQPALSRVPPVLARVALILPLAVLMPLLETMAYSSPYYCFDDAAGKWWLNLLIYGSWQATALFFYPSFDEQPGESQPVRHFVVRGFATVGIVLFAMQITTDVIAPHFTEVIEGARYVNDWSPDNCLGPKPD
jgi:hypothetical protein